MHVAVVMIFDPHQQVQALFIVMETNWSAMTISDTQFV